MTTKPSQPFSLEIEADLLAVRGIAEWLAEIAQATGLDASACAGYELALVEICNNIVTHGYGVAPGESGGSEQWLKLEGQVSTVGFAVQVTDAAPPFDPDSIAEPDPQNPTVHGYGIMIVRQLTTSFSVGRVGDHNIWKFLFPVEDNTAEPNNHTEDENLVPTMEQK